MSAYAHGTATTRVSTVAPSMTMTDVWIAEMKSAVPKRYDQLSSVGLAGISWGG